MKRFVETADGEKWNLDGFCKYGARFSWANQWRLDIATPEMLERCELQRRARYLQRLDFCHMNSDTINALYEVAQAHEKEQSHE